MDGSPDTTRTEPEALLDDLPPGIAWLRGPAPAVADSPGPAEWPALRQGQVATWLPDGRWLTDADEDDPVDDRQPETGRRRGREGTDARLPSAHSRLGTNGSPDRARRGRRRVALARIGARLGGWPRRVLIGILLVTAAALAVSPQPTPPPAATGPTEPVVVAARDLAAGTELAAADLRVVPMPVGIVPAGSSRRAAGLIGRVAAGAIRRGETLTDARVVGPGLAAGLAPGETAVPVRIADADTAALVRVGDRVDVLGTPVAPDGGQAGAGETVTVASALRVLAVLRGRDPADGLVLVVATGEAAARTLVGAAARQRLTANVRPP